MKKVKLSDYTKKRFNNLKYALKKTGRNTKTTEKLLNTTLRDFTKYSDFKKALYSLERELMKGKMGNVKKGSKKYFDIGKKNQVFMTPKERDKFNAKMNETLNTKRLTNIDQKLKDKKIKSNKYNFKLTVGEINDFEKLRKQFNKKRKQLFKEVKNKELKDFLMGENPVKGLGRYNPMRDFVITADNKDNFNNLFDRDDYTKAVNLFNKVLNPHFTLEKYHAEQKKRIIDIFLTGRYANIDSTLMQDFFDTANKMSIPQFYAWYQNSNESMSFKERYLRGKLDGEDIASDDELEDDINYMILEMQEYTNKFNNYYNGDN